MDAKETLQEIRSLIESTVAGSAVGVITSRYPSLLASGKMLRARLVVRIGSRMSQHPDTIRRAGAAVELMHSGSLLHDDVIDGGALRRGAPAFWTERGTKGAILLGDLFFFLALRMVSEIDEGRMVAMLVREAGTVCEAESEQELALHETGNSWETCVDVARRKTGPLFAFAAYAGAGIDRSLAKALRTSGYEIGTAYQLSDDILDATGDPEKSGKTLRTDEQRHTATSMNVSTNSPEDGVAHIKRLCRASEERLKPWPEAFEGWTEYINEDMGPALANNLAGIKAHTSAV